MKRSTINDIMAAADDLIRHHGFTLPPFAYWTPEEFRARTDARLILTCVYGAIGVGSAGLIALHLAQHAWAVPMTVALFSVQIVYKLGTVALVGLGSPVVMTNLLVVAVQSVALVVLFAQSQP